MDDLRLTVVSDATQEFPNNQNNRFKVRLPRPLVLPEGPWAMSLWSLSVPDEAVEQKLGQGIDSACSFANIHVRLSNVQGGKYTVIEGEDTYIVHKILLSDVFAVRPKTGVAFWTRVHQRIQENCTLKLQKEFEQDTSKRNQIPDAWIPTFRWEGEDFILQANQMVPHTFKTHGLPFAISLKIARAFGFVKQDPVTQKWSLGPNAVPSYPVYDQCKCPSPWQASPRTNLKVLPSIYPPKWTTTNGSGFGCMTAGPTTASQYRMDWNGVLLISIDISRG